MRTPLLVLGAILLVVGGLITAGVFRYDSKETAELGPIELSVTKEKSPPINLGWILLGAGAVAVVIGVASKK
ncbi:hypothetical protein [Arenimonas donghaensis]|uniref:DUF3185 domain-containing protein n=1 Tax=Arenimonas donghaensis DSM 18148 = HO3-R19 TaxID=1121014 RepID=A0A087MHG1_9GAMM|nr:hypothetical protein [Arenimonas donghaensis]KFL36314.1 hypothetical protein N788_05325 [Arenimonas donghaensis DSM 18148 = HO3-R19]